MVLEKITKENDIKDIPEDQLPLLAEEIREFLIEKISCSGGHLASNLGVVELTMALHRELNLPEDKIIWDVGHQSYIHKILTGRQEGFEHLREFGGMSGFPKRKESLCDSFDTGHSSTSISAGLGYVAARELQGGNNTVVSVIGDGSLTGGLAIEALNNASQLKSNFIIILNDNKMSIAENTGGIATLLNNIRTAGSYEELKSGVTTTLSRIPVYGDRMVGKIRKAKSSLKQLVIPAGMLFEDMGITYLGPVDGHDIEQLRKVIRLAKRVNNAVIIHALTKKGKGYEPAERHPARFHGTNAFEIQTGLLKDKKNKADYTDVFSTVMCKLGERDENIVAITAAMPDGTGLNRYARQFPERFFDVGIAEGHAVTFAAGLAAAGMRPIVAVYSSFLQRAYDQVLHDVCMQNLPVVFAIDRAGLVGSDGETHQGVFDLSYLGNIPNMTIMAPKNKWELSDMMKFAVRFDGPIAIRYPRGTACDAFKEQRENICLGKAEILKKGKEILLFALGNMVETAWRTAELLSQKGLCPTVVNARFAKPFDKKLLRELAAEHSLLVTLEENVANGGMGQRILEFVREEELYDQVQILAIPDEFVEHGNVGILREKLGLTPEQIAQQLGGQEQL
ncbi:MAG: 1-deoxy-D-xylulose-5-phosphate synthase [Lachnospiraceae bacterium]|nr:1-deoxy-D-xylulose-5-phosphate synthase [Lachnospiraceae bacterium]